MKKSRVRCSYICKNASKMLLLNYRCLLFLATLCPIVALMVMILLAKTYTQAATQTVCLLVLLFIMVRIKDMCKGRRPRAYMSTAAELMRPLVFFRSKLESLRRPVATPLRPRELFALPDPDVEEGTDGMTDPVAPLTPTTRSRLGAQDTNKVAWIGKPMKMRHSTYIRLDEELGRGASKTVWLAQDINNENRVAWSMVHMAHQSKKENGRAISELALLMSHSPYRKKREGQKAPKEGTIEAGEERLVRLLDMQPSDTHLHIITELIDGGSLRRWSMETGLPKERSPVRQDMDDLCKVANHISHGLAWLHQHQIIHRDVRPENILIKLFPGSDSTRIQSAVLADMGLFAFSPAHLSEKISIAGRDEYLAPEIVRQMVFDDTAMGLYDVKFSANYCSKVDVWMLGLSIAEIPTGQLPSVNIHRCTDFSQYTDVLEQRIECNLRNMGFEDHPLNAFFRHALVVDPDLRSDSASLWELLQHPRTIHALINKIKPNALGASGRGSNNSTMSLPF